MIYETLINFVQNKMRISHIYQPVMVMTLIRGNGKSEEKEIAKSLLSHDESQIEYYTENTNNMVGRVLIAGCPSDTSPEHSNTKCSNEPALDASFVEFRLMRRR